MITFGKRDETLEYRKRTGVYGIIQDDTGRFLTVKNENGLFLIETRILLSLMSLEVVKGLFLINLRLQNKNSAPNNALWSRKIGIFNQFATS